MGVTGRPELVSAVVGDSKTIQVWKDHPAQNLGRVVEVDASTSNTRVLIGLESSRQVGRMRKVVVELRKQGNEALLAEASEISWTKLLFYIEGRTFDVKKAALLLQE